MAVRILPRSPLLRYLAVRLALIVPTVLILVTVVFFFMRVIGDPITASQGGRLSAAQLAERKAAAGFDRPILQQYGDYLGGLVRGDFGTALTDHRAIREVLVTNGAATLELAAWALLIAFLVDAAPVFFVGLLLKLPFSATPGWLPASGRASASVEIALNNVAPKTNIMIIDAILYGDPAYIGDVLQHAILPALALGLLTAGVFIRLIRINLLETMRTDYVIAARARGVSERLVVRQHAFRNALVPVVTVMGMQIAMMLGGAILTETTFEWQGLGYVLSRYLLSRDFVAVQGIVTAIAVVVAFSSFLIDVINALVDPRVRY